MGSRYRCQVVRGLCLNCANFSVCTCHDSVNLFEDTGETEAGLQLDDSNL